MGMALPGIGGFDTTQIVEQLMYLESRPGRVLNDKKASIETTTKAYQNLNSQLAALTKNAWSVFGKEDKFDMTFDPTAVWGAVKGSSNNEKVSVTTTTGAAIGSVEFDIKALAQSKQITFNNEQLANFASNVGDGGSFSILVGNKITNITPASNSMEDIAKAINSVKDAGVSATVVRTSDGADGKGEYVLQITGKETGSTAGNFQIYAGDVTKGLSVSPKETQNNAASNSITYTFEDAAALRSATAGVVSYEGTVRRNSSDAVITLYGEDHTYQSNKIELMDHVTVDISGVKAETKADGTNVYGDYLTKGIKIDVVADNSPASEKVKSLVDNLNKVLGTLADGMKGVEKVRYDEKGKRETYLAPGVLSTSVGRQVQTQLGDLLSSGVTITGADGKSQTYSLSALGVDLKNEGGNMTVNFDADKFQEMMEGDPTKVEKIMTAFAEKVADYGNRMSDSADGMMKDVIKAGEDEQAYYKDRISDFEDRMALKRESLQRQYSALETMLANFNSQQSWLASQLATLPKMS